ncbi:amidohydrolase family protein [Paenibacillus chitinolyticus]|uniref:amidohydrolase family protein n=1 Tax=Paenibacillus chitinolyticus TaxID=79263 RepID=UPI0036DEA30D
MEDFKMFDVDQHLCDLNICNWETVLPTHLQHKAPKNITYEGVERLSIEDKLFPKPAGKGCGSPLGSKAGGNVSIDKRVQWMSQVGIDSAVLTPGNLGMAIHAIEDNELKHAVCERYRNWQVDQAEEAGEHCTAGILIDPFSLPDPSLLKNSKVSCLYMRPTNRASMHLWEKEMLPIYQLASEYNLPLLFHSGTGYYQNSPVSDQYENYFYSHLFSHTTEIQMALAELVGHGIISNYPDLKVVFVEAGVSWVPSFVSRLQHHVQRLGRIVPGGKQNVYELLEKQCLFSVFNEDADGLGTLLAQNPWLKTILGSDYPHWDTMNVKNILKDVDGEMKKDVAYRNAEKLFERIKIEI